MSEAIKIEVGGVLLDALKLAVDHLQCVRDFDEDSPWDDPGACARDGLRKINAMLEQHIRQQTEHGLT